MAVMGLTTTAEPTTETALGMVDTMVPALPHMEPTAAPTPQKATIPPPERTHAARPLRRRTARKRSGRHTTHTREPMAQPIKAPTRIRSGEARRCRRTARRLTRSIIRMQTEPSGPPRVQTATSTRPRTETPTRTPGAAGRAPAPLMQHTAGEAVVDRTITAAIPHLHSADGAAILVATRAGGPDLRAARAGAAAAAVEAGADEAVVEVGAGAVRGKDRGEDHENPERTEERNERVTPQSCEYEIAFPTADGERRGAIFDLGMRQQAAAFYCPAICWPGRPEKFCITR